MKTVAVIFGGRSTEHDISVVTAIASVIKPLEASGKYVVEPIYITKDGKWYWDSNLKNIVLYQSGQIDQYCSQLSQVLFDFSDGLVLNKVGRLGRIKSKKIDIVFPAMHGTHGEDGELMGLLEMAGVCYVGCDMPSSVISMDKVLAKEVVIGHNIQTPKWISYRKSENEELSQIIARAKSLRLPFFVKPAHLGSSIGISRVSKISDLENAIELALHYDDKIIIEEAVENLVEVTLPIMGNDELRPGLLERPISKEGKFFDFDTKYLKEGKGTKAKSSSQGYSELPAKLSKPIYDKAVHLACNAYHAIGCSGIARVDMLIDSKSQVIYFNEINPLPGSLYMHNWQAAGKSAVNIVDELIQLALQKYNDKRKLQTFFDTNYLKQF